jgi:hypothetical protein
MPSSVIENPETSKKRKTKKRKQLFFQFPGKEYESQIRYEEVKASALTSLFTIL